MTKIIGLTGGIGSGKSTIAKFFENEGIPVYNSDNEAKKIMNLPKTIQIVSNTFGKQIVKNNVVDTKALSVIVFADANELKKLNAIIHPLVKQHFDEWVQTNNKQPFVVKEAAILFETGGDQFCDEIILVTAPEKVRIERVIKRDNCTAQQVLDRIKNQWSDSDKISKSSYIIENEDINIAKSQFEVILKKLRD